MRPSETRVKMAVMKKKIPSQVIFGLSILVIGGGLIGGEYLLVKWYPGHQQRVNDETLKQRPYHNDSLGIDVQIADGLYGSIQDFPGGVKISRSKFWSIGSSLTITSQPNPDQHLGVFSGGAGQLGGQGRGGRSSTLSPRAHED